ncbi:MAG: hypothetical protein MUQ10_11940 [Anaerolineae bacterium]|nr:hypothetical protein [Anaerolineae bacterium]
MTTETRVQHPSTAPNRPSRLEPVARRALWGGILFSLLFSGAIWSGGLILNRPDFLPDTGASWYYWKLPEPTAWSRITSWGFYALHQITSWGLIAYAQTRVKRYTRGLHPFNKVALAINAGFILLHFIQTQIWYDGIAQDVSIWSSQGSVILMLVMILLMENRRRGLFWGRKVPISEEAGGLVRRYHGYVFAWATVYTFWYHPMESTSGHLIGFFYMFLLMLQGSLFFTRVHTNRWWMLTQEVAVLFHGTLVALMQGNGMWSMFFFGFGGLFVLTQMHGVPLPKWARWAFLGSYIASALVTYSIRDITMLHQITWIPIIEYVAVFVLAGLISLGVKLTGPTQRPAGAP